MSIEISEGSTFSGAKAFFSFKLYIGLVTRQHLFYFKSDEGMGKLAFAMVKA